MRMIIVKNRNEFKSVIRAFTFVSEILFHIKFEDIKIFSTCECVRSFLSQKVGPMQHKAIKML